MLKQTSTISGPKIVYDTSVGKKMGITKNSRFGRLEVSSGLPKGARWLGILYRLFAIGLFGYMVFGLIPNRKEYKKEDYSKVRHIAVGMLMLSLYSLIHMRLLKPCFEGSCRTTYSGYTMYTLFLLFGAVISAIILGIVNDDDYKPPPALSTADSLVMVICIMGILMMLIMLSIYKTINPVQSSK